MRRLILDKTNLTDIINETIILLKQGGTIVYPTDTIYGLGANIMDTQAVERVFKIKQRPKTKALPIVIRNIKWAEAVAYVYERERKILQNLWHGTITVVLPKRREVPNIITADKPTVALRIPEHDFIDKLLGKFGYPITGTSANISDQQPSQKISEIIAKFENESFKPDLIIDAGDLPESEPSTILDISGFKPKILRVGMTKPETLLKLLEI